MKVLIIGSGEENMLWLGNVLKMILSKHVFVCPGNAGTHLEHKVSNVELDINEFSSIEEFCLLEKIELVIIGPEQPLVDGIVDYLEKFNINVFGPNKLLLNLKVQKYLQNKFVKNLIYQQQILEFFLIEKKLKYI